MQDIFVFVSFNLRPDNFSKLWKSVNSAHSELTSPSKKTFVSSAYWLSFVSCSLDPTLIFIPPMVLSALIAFPKISAHKINR